MEKSNFRDWTLTEADTAFNVRQVPKLSTLTAWVSVDKSVSDYEEHYLSDLQESFVMGIGALNEAELASRVISPMTTIEAGASVSPGTTIYHYIIKAEGTFTGFLQHLVNNKSTGVITDMTTICAMKGS